MATGGDSVDSPVSGRLRSQDVPTDSLTGLVTSELMRKAKSTREKLLHSPGREEGESITYYQKFMTLGTQMELKGDSLRAFADAKIKEIEDVRANKERLSLEKKKLAMEERKLEEARVEAQKQREFEESIAQKQREMEEKKLGEAREEAQKQRDFEEAKVQRMEKMESERIDEMKKLQDEAQRHAERLEEQRANNQRAHQKARDGMVESTKVTLPAFDENKEDIEAYLTKFERFAEELDWDQTTWARRVSTKLNVKATTLIGDMSKEDARDYQLVKKELLRGFRCTAESYREKFRAARRKSEETFSTYVSRITRYLHSWMDLAEKQRTYKDLFDLVLLEQLLTGIPQSVATFIRQSKATNGETFDMTVRVNGKAVVAIRDTGSPMLCVSADLIDPTTYTNRTREVSGVFEEQGTVQAPIAIVKEYSGADGVDHRQLVVPSEFQNEVMRLAHDAPMAGHLGGTRTRNRIWTEFYWPGMCPDIRRYVASCDACQRTTAKGKVKPVPLERMPLIDVPFKQVAVDIIGPIHPPSDRGHRFILVTVDYATRYPEATPLKKIDTPHVAEALWENWTRVGIPEKVLSDNGTQFKSEMMQEVYNLMSVHGMYTTPYHAQCNGLVERFNGTLKQMLKRLCQEQPKEWDRFIPACLFAYREVPQESLKFSPFELLYGRTVRGPMQVLRKLWTKEETDQEVRTTAEYVVDLRNRVEETCRIARENLGKATERYARAADRKAEDRQFKEGDEVLLLLPMKKNKLEIAWRGPYVIKERCGMNDYRIQVGSKKKLFHVNLLKRYVRRREIPAVVGVVLEEEELEEVPEVSAGQNTIPLVPLEAGEGPKDVSINDVLPAQKQQELRDLTIEFENQFTDLPRTTNLEECEITVLEDTPVRVRQYPLPHVAMDCIRKEVQDMLKLGVIEPCASPYSAPLVLIKKPDGKMRTCQDFRKLNQIVRFDGEPLPDVEYLFAKLHRAKYLSKLDLTKGYWQIPVKESDRDKTAFTTPQGQFRWTRMPFGLRTAGAIFSRMMRKLLEPLGRTDVDNFVDDLLISNEDWDEHLRALRAVLTRMAAADLAARPKKCFLGYQQVVYLGHKVGQGCMMPEEVKIEKFKALGEPKTKKEVRRFLGMLGFYRRYVPHFSEIALPLTNLTKGKKFEAIEWTPACQEAFERLKETLVSQPVVRLPDPEKAFVLRTDASDVGLGAVLLQADEKGDLQPVSYASKKLIPAEINYSTIEKECLAMVWGIRKFEPYLFGQHFTLMTDHQPLQYLQQVRPHNGRLTRWALQLQAYSFRVQTIKGVNNVDADFMSRVALDI
ncbi:uncharacterized protein [Littorina saxatilis]|uniref:uncharacterized protein n=1 Tax=Littorina saxatilis TaxID=31220 RepID=UPI0038B4F32A